ncbi:MAG TPA: protein-methionine-sulfoxide reductase catalytic subunit MsrP [Bryobacteraceae bacterium]|jgi:sulfoxide reductase catalytic subunit YedY|nr:protein-methionine-sulfoxide reductase catalytic subunit MsrP [Bryobacteraceae bacterium]
MVIRKSPDLRYSQVTPRTTYLNRRRFLAAGSITLGMLRGLSAATTGSKLTAAKSPLSTSEPLTPLEAITHYNNFYEFGTDKEDPSKNAYKLRTSPWSVKVEGAVSKSTVLDLDAIFKLAPLEERIYRHRCVERWSMVIPWIGFPLSALLKRVEPTSKAKFVAFESVYDSKTMLNAQYAGIQFPYIEGLRMDEAMHPLTLLAVGLYGESLPNQDGAPFRLVVPWKYGFKSIKSIVKIKLVEKEPSTTWNLAGPNEYGFYSNVNPERDHPRWSQEKERRLGEFRMRDTIKFNGYGDQVANLYTGMDLVRKYY